MKERKKEEKKKRWKKQPIIESWIPIERSLQLVSSSEI